MEARDAELLATALNHPDGRARIAAAEALAERGETGAVPALDPLARSVDDFVAQRAVVALWKLRPRCGPDIRARIDQTLDAYRLSRRAGGTEFLSDPAVLVEVGRLGTMGIPVLAHMARGTGGLLALLCHPALGDRLDRSVVDRLADEAVRVCAIDLRQGIDALGAADPARDAVVALTALVGRLHTTELGDAAAWSLYIALERCAAELTVADLELLLPLLERWHRAPDAATLAAVTLIRLATMEPAPALRAALPLLRGGVFRRVPPAFEEARKAVERATAVWKDLPLPAPAPRDDSADLPLPTKEPPDA